MKKRAMKKYIPVATGNCDDCKLLSNIKDEAGNVFSKCAYTGMVWLHDNPGRISVDDRKRCGAHESAGSYTKARLKNLKILSELYKYESNKFNRNYVK